MIVDIPTINTIFSALLALVFWFSRRTIDALEAKLAVQELALQNVKIDYLHKNEFKDFKAELRTYFEDLKKDIKEIRNAP